MARFSAIRIPAISKVPKMAPCVAISAATLVTTMLATTAPGLAADVTPERLVNPDIYDVLRELGYAEADLSYAAGARFVIELIENRKALYRWVRQP